LLLLLGHTTMYCALTTSMLLVFQPFMLFAFNINPTSTCSCGLCDHAPAPAAPHPTPPLLLLPSTPPPVQASRRVPWDQVSPADKLLLTTRQIREKYVYKK
jgi:hypothetical protein